MAPAEQPWTGWAQAIHLPVEWPPSCQPGLQGRHSSEVSTLPFTGAPRTPAAQTSTHHLLHEPPVPTLGGLHSQDLLLPCYR